MRLKLRALALLFSLVISLFSVEVSRAAVRVSKVYDGDTITLSTGQKVRLLQVDTPELSPNECYGKEAKRTLVKLLEAPGVLSLRADAGLDSVDSYGRLLRYVFKGKLNINLRLVEVGAAMPYFHKGVKGQYAAQILKAAQYAKSNSLGVWKNCHGSELHPHGETSIRNEIANNSSIKRKSLLACDENYSGCIPKFPPDIDCIDVKLLGLAPVKVIKTDVHNLDQDGDGMGCDS